MVSGRHRERHADRRGRRGDSPLESRRLGSGFVAKLQPHLVLLMPDGTIDHWSDGLAEPVTLA